MKILLGIPTNRGIKSKTVKSLLDMVAYSQHDFVIVMATEGYTTAENRNYLAVQALRENADYLMMVDDDMTFPKDTLEKLLAVEQGIVGVASNSRALPLSTTVSRMDAEGNYVHPDTLTEEEKELPKEPFKAYGVGGGVILIDTNVFRVIDRPWFLFTPDPVTGQMLIGEDQYFCNRAKEKGYEIWCDPTITIGHIGDYIY